MGAGWRRFSESFKQKTPFVSGGFSPTQNQRNEIMLKETADLAAQLKAALTAIKSMKEANANGMQALGRLLSSTLPRIYEDGNAHSQVAPALVGNGMDFELLVKQGRDAAQRLETQVIAPLMQWLALHETLVAKNKELDLLRLEVDSRRRTVADLTVKEATVRARAQRSRDDKHGIEVEKTGKLLEHKTAKLSASHQEYVKFEEELHTRIFQLICDAAYIKVHIGQALANQSAALAEGCKLVETTAIPEIPRVGPSSAASPLATQSDRMGTPKVPPSPVGSVVGPSSQATTPSGDHSNPFNSNRVVSSPNDHQTAASSAHLSSVSIPEAPLNA